MGTHIWRWLTLATVLVAGWPSATIAQAPYIKQENVVFGAVAGTFTAATINATTSHPQANWAICTVTGDVLAYTIDGTTPTSSSVTVQVNQVFSVTATQTISGNYLLNQFKGIRVTADSTARCHFGQ